jgi:hypothetical protein
MAADIAKEYGLIEHRMLRAEVENCWKPFKVLNSKKSGKAGAKGRWHGNKLKKNIKGEFFLIQYSAWWVQ